MRSDNHLLTAPEVADLLRVRLNTIYAWAETGILPCHRLGRLLRFDPGQIHAWLDERGTGLVGVRPSHEGGAK